MRARLTKCLSVAAAASLCILAAVAGGASAAGAGTQVYAWGYTAGGGYGDCAASGVPNSLCGQTGVADVQFVTTPTTLAAIPDATAIGAGMFHSLAVRADGSVWAWGMNGSGQLGSGGDSGAFSVQPVQVPGITNAVAVAGGWHQSHAIRADGTLWSWGSAFTGLGSYSSFAPPTQVPGLSGVASVAAGESASYAVLSDGTLWSWGFNGNGQLGTGSFDSFAFSPVQVAALQDVTAVASHFAHALALKRDGMVWAWGYNAFGQLGDGTHTERRTPVQVAGLDHVVAVAAGAFVSFALRDDGTVWTWGADLGGGADHVSPIPIAGFSNVEAIAAGGGHLLARNTDGSLRGWGANGLGQLGLGTQTAVESVPVQISVPDPAGIIAAGRAHSLAAAAVPPTCNGKPATIVGPAGDSTVTGTSGADVIVDLSGNNKIRGFGGNDTICAGPGNDAISGGGGADWVDAGDGLNSVEGNSGRDTLITGSGIDELEGNGGDDTLTGGRGADKFRGGDGTDTATDFRPAEGDIKVSVEVVL